MNDMRILIVHNQYKQSGGEDCVFQNELKLLRGKGHNVEIVLFDNRTIISTLDKLLTAVSCIFNLRSYWLFIEKIKQFKPDVIHVHNFFPLISPSVFYAASKCNVPVVMTLHNYRLICPNALLLRNARPCINCIDKIIQEKGIFCKCYRNSVIQSLMVALHNFVHSAVLKTWHKYLERIIVLSEFSKKIYQKSFLKEISKKMIVKPNFTSQYEVKEKCEKEYYIYVGRLSIEKGINVLMDAFDNSDILLKLVGDGPLEIDVNDYFKEKKNVEMYGFLEKEDMLELMSNAKALIFPSICFENCPLIILEAFMLGVPVLCSNRGGSAELIKNGENGLLFEAGNACDLRNIIDNVETNEYLLEKLSLGALQSYKELYSPESNYQMLFEIYKNSIASYQSSV